jgi:hypothetical protein
MTNFFQDYKERPEKCSTDQTETVIKESHLSIMLHMLYDTVDNITKKHAELFITLEPLINFNIAVQEIVKDNNNQFTIDNTSAFISQLNDINNTLKGNIYDLQRLLDRLTI